MTTQTSKLPAPPPVASVNGSIADALDAVLSAVHSVHTTMAFTPIFAKHHLEADIALIRNAAKKIEKLRWDGNGKEQ